MVEPFAISQRDAIPLQGAVLGFSGVAVLVLGGFVLISPSWNAGITLLLALVVVGLLNYMTARMWNVRYSPGYVLVENLYATRRYPLAEVVEVLFLLPPSTYCITFSDKKSYCFALAVTHDLTLLTKADAQFFAKQIAQQLQQTITAEVHRE